MAKNPQTLMARAWDIVRKSIPKLKSLSYRTAEDRKRAEKLEEEHENDIDSFIERTRQEIAVLEPKVGPQARAVIGPVPDGTNAGITLSPTAHAATLVGHKLRLESALAAGPDPVAPTAPAPKPAAPKPAAPKPAAPKPAASTPVATKPAPAITAESIGAAVIATTTHPNPAISAPARTHLEGITTLARSAGTPCFDFLPAWEKISMKKEFAERGGLSERSHRLFTRRRAEFCVANKMTPEEAFSMSGAPLPQIVIQSQTERKAREEKLSRAEALHREKINALNVEIIQNASNPEQVKKLVASKRDMDNWIHSKRVEFAAPVVG